MLVTMLVMGIQRKKDSLNYKEHPTVYQEKLSSGVSKCAT